MPGQPELTLHVAGEVLTLDGVAIDLSAIPEGGEGWPSDEDGRIAGPIRRIDGVLHVHIVARLDDTATPHQDGPWVIETASSDVTIPATRKEVQP